MKQKTLEIGSLIVFTIFSCLASSYANAEISWLSRANCTPLEINESITWDSPFNPPSFMKTSGVHTRFGELDFHTVSVDWDGTWRSYAGDTGDSGASKVEGTHTWYTDTAELRIEYTYATDCNLSEW